MSSLLDLKGLVGDLTSHCELTDGETPKISQLKKYRNPKNAVNFSNRTVNLGIPVPKALAGKAPLT